MSKSIGKKLPDVIERTVVLKGLTDLMMDRYADKNVILRPWEKLYYVPGTRTVCIPAANIISFLCAKNTSSAVKRFHDPRKYLKLADAIQSYVSVSPQFIPITRSGKKIELVTDLEDGVDTDTGIFIHYAVARLKGGIPNDKIRPVIPLPWELEFKISIFRNTEGADERELQSLFEKGGIAIGLGTFRGIYGKFQVAVWK